MRGTPNPGHRQLFVIITVLFALMITLPSLVGCEEEIPDFSDTDFENSIYKHVNNGGITSEPDYPYNIDAITGATLTVEGPAVQMSVPLSIRELENRNEGLFKSVFRDDSGRFIYEGIRLDHIIHEMQEGEKGVILTDTAQRVELKNDVRETIATFTVEEIDRAAEEGRPILLAYGIGTLDEETVAPFVYDAKDEDKHSEGYVPELDNEDGCLRLVYDLKEYGENPDYKEFTNVAYIYVAEESTPGFKHTQTDSVYDGSKYTDYIISFRGEALGFEVPFTVRDLEDMIAYDDAGELIEGGMGYSDEYSLANNAYWYVNEYEGLDLYGFLRYLGMDSAEDMGLADARRTLVTFLADDGRASPESFSVDTLSYPDAFGFYNKNAADEDDGAYIPDNADLVDTGYPVLLAYGVNEYPYTVTKNDDGYLSGLGNSGGPMRVVFGKTQYHHPNGSNQVQYLRDVVVGADRAYSTHIHTDVESQQRLATEELSVRVSVDADDAASTETTLTVADIENLIHGPDADPLKRKSVALKDSYQVEKDGSYPTDIYEGVSLEHLLMDVVRIPGTAGTVTFRGSDGELELNLDELFRTGYNTELGRDGLKPILAFAKNGAPLVEDESSPGYVSERVFSPSLAHEPETYHVDNAGGPLTVIVPSSDPEQPDVRSLAGVESIEVSIVPDSYAHLEEPYAELASTTVEFIGDGLETTASYTTGDLELMQREAQTLDFSIREGSGDVEKRYRGIPIYDLLVSIGLKSNAGDVIVTSADGSTATFSLGSLKATDVPNTLAPDKPGTQALIAYGVGDPDGDTLSGTPLVAGTDAEGFVTSAGNDEGPLAIVVPRGENAPDDQVSVAPGVVSVEVTANEIDGWGHAMSDLYGEFLDNEFTLKVANDDSEWERTFTVSELEAMSDLIVRDTYTVLDLGEMEGLVIWKLVERYAGDIEGIQDPIGVAAYAEDGYSNDLLANFGLEALKNGVLDDVGVPKPLILAYAQNGYPLVDVADHEGYTGLAGNADGPLRIVAETNQGASVKYVERIVVTVPGSGPIEGRVD